MNYRPIANQIPDSLCSGLVLDALHMDEMMRDVDSWRRDPESFLRRRGLNPECAAPSGKEVFVLIVEGFLIFNDRYRRSDLMSLRPF